MSKYIDFKYKKYCKQRLETSEYAKIKKQKSNRIKIQHLRRRYIFEGACRNGNLFKVRKIITLNPHSLKTIGPSGLCVAILFNNTQIINYLIDQNINVDTECPLGTSPFLETIRVNNLDLFLKLLPYHKRNQRTSATQLTCLMTACKFNRPDFIEYIIKHEICENEIHATVEQKVKTKIKFSNMSALSFAIREGNLEICKFLLEKLEIKFNEETDEIQIIESRHSCCQVFHVTLHSF